MGELARSLAQDLGPAARRTRSEADTIQISPAPSSSTTTSQEPALHSARLDSTDFFILRLCKQALPVKTIGDSLLPRYRAATPKISQAAAQKRTYRRIEKLREAGLLELVNPHSKPFLLRSGLAALDLLSSARNSNHRQTSPFELPVRAAEERKQAIRFLQASTLLTSESKDEIKSFFEAYLNDIDDKEIVLRRKGENLPGEAPRPDFLFLPYQTRFTNPEHTAKNLHIYNNIWDNATSSYKRAVHLVLTTNPKRFKSLWHANRHFSIAFNRFLSYLTKHFKGRPRYLTAYEYTKSGLMHCHCIIFGIPYLLPHLEITQEWERCGQGSYNYIYSLVNNNGRWLYARKKPIELKDGETARDYLVKYISKGTSSPEGLFLYWAFNKRFFTYSRALYTDIYPRLQGTGIYEFFGTCYTWSTPDVMLERPHAFRRKAPPWALSTPALQQLGGAA